MSTRELAEELEVHVRSVRRDIQWAQESGFPIERVRRGSDVLYSLDGRFLRDVAFTRREREALSLARQASQVFDGSAAVRTLDALTSADSIPPAHLYVRFLKRRGDNVCLSLLDKAIRHRKYVRVLYTARGETARARELAPVRLVAPTSRAIYLLAWDPVDERYKHYHLARCAEVALLDRDVLGLPPPPKPDDATVLIFHDEPIEVLLRFDADVADIVPEYPLTENQTIKRQEDGSLLLYASVRGLLEVRGFVLGWGSACEVLEPVSLRRALRDELERALEPYRRLEPPVRRRTTMPSVDSVRVVTDQSTSGGAVEECGGDQGIGEGGSR